MNDHPTSVLVVDDNAENRVLLSGLLKPHHQVLVVTGGVQAISLCQQVKPDIVLMDVMISGMDGYEVCERLMSDPKTQDIPVILMTSNSQVEDEQKGFAAGAVDFIHKPVSPPILISRINTHLRLKGAMYELSHQNDVLESRVKERTHELEMLQDATIGAMASLAETRDNETGNHIRRTQHYIKALAQELARSPHYSADLTPSVIDILYKSAPLHDIGKVRIPDSVLLKPGKLTDDEFDQMKCHTRLGREVLMRVEETLDFTSDFLTTAKDIVYSHQEKWDGSGYPEGLSGTDIPLSARLMAVVDVYDALISERVYRPAFAHERARGIIIDGAGSHFEPMIVDAFLRIEKQFKDIAMTYKDSGFDVDTFELRASDD
ncbi:HD domain-containing phosphohydrolase [Vibrio ostreicida]|uniref:Two-component system response regulator n=1 Tax=Vibrio ostreicida TaxID=526588 RepID=A0ABT8BXG9_9VIBR|nr:two-component system response regulator [Vibrio ostreicida]MDN3611846.1 two-component system response regulator [Vibrio ostreicida]NPD09656.1 two-component system response regulator [Vibrio ostreicida]